MQIGGSTNTGSNMMALASQKGVKTEEGKQPEPQTQAEQPKEQTKEEQTTNLPPSSRGVSVDVYA